MKIRVSLTTIIVCTALAAGNTTAAAGLELAPGEPSPLLAASSGESTTFATLLLPPDGTSSLIDVEPDEPHGETPPDPPHDIGYALVDGGLRVDLGLRTNFNQLRVRVSFEEDDPDGRVWIADRVFAGRSVRIQRAPFGGPRPTRQDTLSTGGRPLRDIELLVNYVFREVDGRRNFGVSTYELVDHSGTAVDLYKPGLWLTDVAGSCEEQGMIQFGLFPYGMPAVKWPEITGCSESRCADIAEAWLHLHHNVWRANQMIAVLDPMHPEQKKYFWKQPGTDANGDAVTIRTSPAYWFGELNDKRYNAVREVILDYRDIMLTAKTGIIKLRLQCPDSGDNPGNPCFTVNNMLGHHWVKGWVNFCSAAFTEDDCDNDIPGLTRVMHHEPLHHVFTHINGLKAIRDTITHFHGNSCLGSPVTKAVYCEEGNGNSDVRHFVEYGSGCWHWNKVVQTVDAYALFIQLIGDMVLDGEMTHWPKLADPTPEPPDCEEDPGCLCVETPFNEDPDGDYSADMYCPDNEASPSVCMTTKFNASDTVGICTLCDEYRGPGCPCNDVTQPCEKGFCWGDDTFALAAGTGTCYEDPPPSWGCLADCELLLGNGAFCMHEHPDHARCVPVGTSLPEASNCWWDGGHMDPQELSCTMQEECIDSSDCHDLGYPDYFVCDQTLRCVPNP